MDAGESERASVDLERFRRGAGDLANAGRNSDGHVAAQVRGQVQIAFHVFAYG